MLRRAAHAAWRLPVVVFAALAVAACAEYLLAPETPPLTPHAIHLDRQSLRLDDGQHDRLVATVLDQTGATMTTLPAGMRVVWSTSADSVAAVDTAGGISASWPGQASVSATVQLPGASLSMSAAVTVRAVPTSLAVTAGDSQAGTVATRLPKDFVARLTERHGLPVVGDTVVFAISGGGGALTAAAAITDTGGRATVGLVPDTLAGVVTVQAHAARLPAAVVQFAARIGPAGPGALTIRSGDGQHGIPADTLAQRLVVRVSDRYGNVIRGAPVTWSVVTGGGSVAGASATTDSTGQAAAVWTMGPSGTQTARASVDTLSVLFSATAGAGAARLAFTTQPTATTAGVAIAPAVVVTVEDSLGHPVPSWSSPITIALGTNPSGATLGGTLSQPATTGTASFGDLALSAAGTGYTLVASTPGLTGATSAAFDVAPPVTFWDATADFSQTANPNGAWSSGYVANLASPFVIFPSFTVTQLAIWYDPANFAIATPIFGKNISTTTQFAVPPGQITLHPGCNAGEYAELRWTAPRAGSYLASVQFFAGDVGNTDAAVILTSGPPIYSVASTTSNPGYSTLRTLAAGDIFRFDVGTGGDGCLSDNTPLTATVRAVSGLTLSAVTSTTLTGAVGTSVGQPQVKLVDAAGAPVPGAMVGFAILGGSSAPVVVPTDASGIATGPAWTLSNTVGQNTMTAFINGVNSVVFTATGTAGAPAQLAFTTQPGPSYVGLPITPAVVVAVEDASGNIVTSATGPVVITIGTNPGGTTLGGTFVGQLSGGTATFATLTLGAVGTGYTLIASSTIGVTSAISTPFDVTSAPVASVGVTPGTATLALGVPRQLVATPADAAGNPITGKTITWSTSDSTVVSVSPAGLVMGFASGTATISATTGGITGTATITISTTGPARDGLFAAGYTHTCAIRAGFHAYCWGSNGSGALGVLPTWPDYNSPRPVNTTLLFTSISAGIESTCGITVDSLAYCWGNNSSGQVGNGLEYNVASPVLVSGGLKFVQIKLGWKSACALTTAGDAYCWGYNNNQIAGPGGTTQTFSGYNQDVPKKITGGPYTSLAMFGYHACALDNASNPWCWGANYQGETSSSSGTPYPPVSVSTLTGLTNISIAAGDYHSCAATAADGTWCWGADDAGQLGHVTGQVSNPIPVGVQGGSNFRTVYAGNGYSCGLLADGTAYCWGRNTNGQLGTGDTVSVSAAAAVAGGLHFSFLALGATHTCGVTLTGAQYCWGDNTGGMLGDGTTTPRLLPALIP